MKPWNSVNGVAYGIPHGRGANVLMYRTDKVSPAPDSWGAVFDKGGREQGRGNGIRLADLYRRRGRLPHGDQAGARHHEPVRARRDPARRGRGPAQGAEGEYRGVLVRLHQGRPGVQGRLDRPGTSWQVIVNPHRGREGPGRRGPAQEGATGWSDTWMVATKSTHKTCAYKFIDHPVSPKTNAAIAEWFGEAPATSWPARRRPTRRTARPTTPRTRRTSAKVYYWNTPIPQCLDGRTDVVCTDYATWTKTWTEIRNS